MAGSSPVGRSKFKGGRFPLPSGQVKKIDEGIHARTNGCRKGTSSAGGNISLLSFSPQPLYLVLVNGSLNVYVRA